MGYSKDFNDKVIAIMARDKMSVRQAAQHFNLCIQTIQNWKKSTISRPIPGRPAKISKKQILKDVEQYPDDYIKERAERFGTSTYAVFVPCMQQTYRVKKDIKTSQSRPNTATTIPKLN